MAKKSSEKTSAAKKSAAPAKKPAPAAKGKAPAGGAKKQASGTGGGAPQTPMIDTSLAASNAAAMILNRAVTGGGTPQAGATQPAKKESASFKNLKDSLNKPAAGGLGGNFGGIGAQKKSGQNFGGGKQVGRNQTFGADVNRAGVPRRTGGG
jgi:hypothetical protein